VHVPAASSETLFPVTAQTPGVLEAKVTPRPDVAEALRKKLEPTICEGIAGKLIA
jgi:hypothetical protein